jgi:hypothetical protein
MSNYPSAHGGGGHANAHFHRWGQTPVIEISDYEHLRKKPELQVSIMQFWFDCMFWWAR